MVRLSALVIAIFLVSTCEASPVPSNVLMDGHCQRAMSTMNAWQQALCLLGTPGANKRRLEMLLGNASSKGNAAASYELGVFYLQEGRNRSALHAFTTARGQGNLLANDQIAALATKQTRDRDALLANIRDAIIGGRITILDRFAADIASLYAHGTLKQPLELAMQSGQSQSALWLVDHNVYDRSATGFKRALDLALDRRLDGVAARLIARSNPLARKRAIGNGDEMLLAALHRTGSGLVGQLLEAGANPHIPGPDGRTAMQYAFDMDRKSITRQFADAGYPLEHLAIAQLESLIANKTGPLSGEPLLAVVAESGRPELVRYLVATGKNPWQTRGSGWPVIELLYLRGQVPLVRTLIARKPPAASTIGLIRLAIDNNDSQTLNLLLHHTVWAPADFPNIEKTPLWQATTAKASIWAPLVAWQISDTRRAPNGQDLLMHAMDTGNADLAFDLVRSGFPVDHKDSFGRTTAWYAATLGSARLLGLLAAKADIINVSDDTGQTPLLRAVKSGNLATVQTALAAGASINASNVDGNTALLLAAAGKPEIVALLLQHHADFKQRNRNSFTALMVAAQSGCRACSDLLMAAGANPSRKDARGRSARDMQSRHQALD